MIATNERADDDSRRYRGPVLDEQLVEDADEELEEARASRVAHQRRLSSSSMMAIDDECFSLKEKATLFFYQGGCDNCTLFVRTTKRHLFKNYYFLSNNEAVCKPIERDFFRVDDQSVVASAVTLQQRRNRSTQRQEKWLSMSLHLRALKLR
jgi:hypothetical protein